MAMAASSLLKLVVFGLAYLALIVCGARLAYLLRPPVFDGQGPLNYFFPVVLNDGNVADLRTIKGFRAAPACDTSFDLTCPAGAQGLYSLSYFDGDYRYHVSYRYHDGVITPISERISQPGDLILSFAAVSLGVIVVQIGMQLAARLRRPARAPRTLE